MAESAAPRDVVLVVEDDTDITELLTLYLNGGGYEVRTAGDGVDGLEALKSGGVSVVLVDIMMPRMNGYDFIRAARAFSDVPIVVVSARSQAVDKMLGLDLGADGYITKPFDPMEAMAYVRAVLRRYRSEKGFGSGPADGPATVTVRDLELDTAKLVLRRGGEVVPLTAAELRLMSKFMGSPGRTFTKAQLYEAVAGEPCEGGEDSVMVHISNIRAKLKDSDPDAPYIRTVRGLGYRLEE